MHYTNITATTKAGIKIKSLHVDTLVAVEEKQLKPLRILRDNLTFDSAIFRHALRLGVTLTVGVAIATLAKLQMGYWVTLTITIVLKPDFGGTFKRFFHRVGGTILGATVAAVLAAAIANKLILSIITVL